MNKVLIAGGIMALVLSAFDRTVPGVAWLSNAAAAGGADALAKACLRCHEGEYSLSELEVGELTRQIRAIRDGVTEHPPGLKGLTDEQIAGMAAILGKK